MSTKKLQRDRARDLAIDTMASWALENMQPDVETVNDINAVLDHTMTLEEFDQKTRDLYVRG